MPDWDDTRTPAERADMSEKAVLYLLTGDEPPIWSVDDLGRAIGTNSTRWMPWRTSQWLG